MVIVMHSVIYMNSMHREIYRYLYAHLDDVMDAEDLTGEVFLKAWQSVPNYNERGIPFVAFLFRIARNALIDHYRRRKHSDPHAPEEMDGIRNDAEQDIGEIISNKTEHQQMLQALSQLKPDFNEVLTLRFIAGLSPDETAEVMNRSTGAVRVLQHRALATLREIMEEASPYEK